tara:strand:- start:34 stop:612 length:579 start_codon:yes stop_codon:yes gene_type:complete
MTVSKHIKPTRIALTTLVLCLIASAVIGIIIVLIGDFEEIQIKILGTVAALAGFSLISLPSIFNLEKQRYQFIGKPGILMSLIFFLLILIIIWGSDEFGNELIGKLTFTSGVIAVALNHILLLFITKPNTRTLLFCQKVTALIICMVASIIIVGVWTEEMSDAMFKVLITLVILDVLGTISLPILGRINFKS